MAKIIPKITRAKASNLFLDAKNPRLPENIPTYNQEDIWEHMKKAYDLGELALSMIENGYFEAEPLVVIPQNTEFSENQQNDYDTYKDNPESKYIVVEGNRRLATIKGLLKNKFNEYLITDRLKEQFKGLPVLVYPNRNDVLAFLGVHHLAGVRKWNVYERARFIVQLLRDKNMPIEDIQKTIGDRRGSAKKTYVCYKLIEIIEEYDGSFNTKDAKSNFSFLQLATGQKPIRNFIGLKYWNNIENLEKPIPDNKKDDLKFLFECLFDNGSKKRLISESRDINAKLSRILDDDEAITILKDTEEIDAAFNMIGGELIGINKLSTDAKNKLQIVNGKLSGMDIKKQVLNHKEGQKLKDTINAISSTTKDINKKF